MDGKNAKFTSSLEDVVSLVKSRCDESALAEVRDIDVVYKLLTNLSESDIISTLDEWNTRRTASYGSKLSNPTGYLVKSIKRRMFPLMLSDEKAVIASMLKEAVKDITEVEMDGILKFCNSDIYRHLTSVPREAALSGLREVFGYLNDTRVGSLTSAAVYKTLINSDKMSKERQRGRDRRSRSRSDDHRRRRSRSRSRDRSRSRSRRRSRSRSRGDERKRDLSSQSDVRGTGDSTASG